MSANPLILLWTMMNLDFSDRLVAQIRSKRTPLIVGLDPRLEMLPPRMAETVSSRDVLVVADLYREFCVGVIDTVASLVPAVKPQAAFFEALGAAGMAALAQVVDHARNAGLMVIMDGKRGDIGSTAQAYARGWLGESSPWRCDALTVNPFLGDDSLEPFVQQCKLTGSGIFVLVRTSNPGGAMLQEALTPSGTVSQLVADHVEQLNSTCPGTSGFGPVGAVVGATHPQQLTELRQRMKHSLFLVPGFGAQGGTAADLAGAFDDQGLGAVINSSRGIIFAFNQPEYSASGDNWQGAVEQATRDAVAKIAESTSAGKLCPASPAD